MMFKTPLFDEHVIYGKIIEFAGYGLPISYTSINEEHNVVRTKVGVLMFRIWENARPRSFGFSAKMTTNDLSTLKLGQAQYSIMCNENGELWMI